MSRNRNKKGQRTAPAAPAVPAAADHSYQAALQDLTNRGAKPGGAEGTPAKVEENSTQQDRARDTYGPDATSITDGRRGAAGASTGDAVATQGWVYKEIADKHWGRVSWIGGSVLAIVAAIGTSCVAINGTVQSAKSDVNQHVDQVEKELEGKVSDLKAQGADHEQRLRELEGKQGGKRSR
jgi:hypothetical protein